MSLTSYNVHLLWMRSSWNFVCHHIPPLLLLTICSSEPPRGRSSLPYRAIPFACEQFVWFSQLYQITYSRYIRKLYRIKDDEDVIGFENVHAYIHHYRCFFAQSNVCLYFFLLSQIQLTGELLGYVVIGEFDPDEDVTWPQWKNKAFPRTTDVVKEIKLLACGKGIGRLLFSWVFSLLSCSPHDV